MVFGGSALLNGRSMNMTRAIMAVVASLAVILVICVTVPACSQVMSDHTAAAGITMPGTTAAAASDLSLESATPGAPASSKAASVPAPPVSITVMETVQVSDGQGETSRSPLNAARSLSLSETSLYQWAHNIIAGSVSPSDSTQSTSAAMVDVTQSFQAPYNPQASAASPITVNESIVVSDAPQVLLPVSILVNESILVSDAPQVLLPVSILVDESIVVSDAPQVALALSITVNESISVYDTPQVGSVSPPAAGKKVAYIYFQGGSLTAAGNFKSSLEENGILTDLVPVADAETYDFSPYCAILIGPNTGSAPSTWQGSEEAVSTVDSFCRPIVGIGLGGASFFKQLEKDLAISSVWGTTKSSIYVMDEAHQVFHTPNEIAVPDNKVIKLYTLGKFQYASYIPAPPPSDVTLLGRQDDDTTHYPLVQESNKYLLWGFNGDTSHMTETGESLFVNLVSFACSLSEQPCATGEVPEEIDTDINRDGKVDERDLGLLRASYGRSEKEAVFDPYADLNKDGRVDLRDLTIFGASYPR